MNIFNFITTNFTYIIGILFLISEIMGTSNYFKNNSIFQLIYNLLQKTEDNLPNLPQNTTGTTELNQ